MPIVPDYKAGDFNPARAQRVQPIDAIDPRGLAVMGGAMVDRAKEDAAQEGLKAGLAAGANSTELQKREGGFLDGKAYNEAFNKGAALQFGAGKEMEARKALAEIESTYELDPSGYQKAAAKAREAFLKGMPDDEQGVELKSFWDRISLGNETSINNRKRDNDRAMQAVTVGDSIGQDINRIEAGIADNGYGDSIDDEITRVQARTAAAVSAGLYTPAQAEALNKDAIYRFTKADYISRVRGGENIQALQDEIARDDKLSNFSLDQRQSIAAEATREANLIKSHGEAERTKYDAELKAMGDLYLRGEGDYDPTLIGSLMQKKGYTQDEIDTTLGGLEFARRVGDDRKILESSTIGEAAAIAQDAQDYAEDFEGSALDKERQFKRADTLKAAYGEMRKAYESDPWAASATYDRHAFNRYDRSNDAGLEAAHADIASKIGNANFSVMPKSDLEGYRASLDQAVDPAQKAAILADIKARYPRNFDRIAESKEAKFTDGERMAAMMLSQGRSYEAQTILIAERSDKETKRYATDEEKSTAWKTAFPDATVFADTEQAGLIRGNFDAVYRYYRSQNMPDAAATEKARKVLSGGYEVQNLNERDQLVPIGTDAAAINSTLKQIKAKPGSYGLRLGGANQATIGEMSNYLADSERTKLVPYEDGYAVMDVESGNPYYLKTATGGTLLVIDRKGNVRRVPSAPEQAGFASRGVWSGSVDVQQETVTLEPDRRKVGGRGVGIITLPDKQAPEAALDTAQRAFDIAQRDQVRADPYAAQLTRDTEVSDYLNGISAAVRGGQMPDWAIDALGELDLPGFDALDTEAGKKALKDAWSNPDERTRITKGGQRMSPLQTIQDILSDVKPKAATRFGTYDPVRFNPQGDLPEVNSLIDALRNRESSNNYKAENSLGYLGAYQFGAAALANFGIIKKSAMDSRTNKQILNDPASWADGYRKEALLKDKDLQDDLMRKLMTLNLKGLKRAGVITADSRARDVAGYLAAAHIGGVGGAKKLKDGKSRKDAYGGNTREYFNLGARAVDGGQDV